MRGHLPILLGVSMLAVAAETPGDVAIPEPGAEARAQGSLILTVRVDAGGVSVLQATRKPDVAFRRPRAEEAMPFRFRIWDPEGTSLEESGFDLPRICLDPTHRCKPAHVEGCVAIPHEAHVNVKVPDWGQAFERIEFQVLRDGRTRPFGTARRAAIAIREEGQR